MGVLLILGGRVVRGSAGEAKAFDKVCGLDAFAEGVGGVWAGEAVGVRIELGDGRGLGCEDRESEAVAGDQIGGVATQQWAGEEPGGEANAIGPSRGPCRWPR
jgi:hypothetical protein